MKTKYFLLILFLLGTNISNSQDETESFYLRRPAEIPSESYFNKITIIDSRADTTHYGIIQKGIFNKKAHVIASKPLETQIQYFLDSLIPSKKGKYELIINIRRFQFAEITRSFTEEGFCFLRFDLFHKDGDNYFPIAFVDTMEYFKRGTDVTKDLLEYGGSLFVYNIMKYIDKEPISLNPRSRFYIQHIDSMEKSQLAIFTSQYYKPGIYKTYTSFKNQKPDFEKELDLKFSTFSKRLTLVKMKNDKGDFKRVNEDSIYIVVKDTQAFINNGYDYSRLYKQRDNIHFVGKGSATANTGEIVAASIILGPIGAAITANNIVLYEYKLDHITGKFIPIKVY